MSSKTRTRKTGNTATTGTLRSVPDRPTTATVRTDTEDKLWAALHANPNSTAADLSAAATIGKSTAQKILVKWEGDGSVTRTPGIAEGGRRAADVWAIADTDTAPDTAVDGTDSDTATEGAPADERAAEDTAPVDTTQDESTTASVVPDRSAIPDDATPVEEELTESVDAEPTIAPAPEDAQDSTDTTADAVTQTEPADAELASTQATTPAADATPDEATPTASGDGKDEKSDRLAPGALRGMVEDWLRDHPGEQAGPTKIAKDLGGKSSGAVSNALDKLVTDGVAVKAQDKPKRFALAPAEQATAAAAAAN